MNDAIREDGLPRTVTVVGVGLLGGSVALAARRGGARVVGVDRDAELLARARQRGVLDAATTSLREGAAAADLVVVCTPVDVIAEQVLAAASLCKAGAILTDVGSTKATIVAALRGRLPSGVAYLGSHPLAGSEKQGLEHARADLFEGRCVVVTPESDTSAGVVNSVVAFWSALGAETTILDPESHDRIVALTSHLPHLVSSALAGVLPADFVGLTATGFRDATRLAGGDPKLWGAIFEANTPFLLEALASFNSRLARFQEALHRGDRGAIEELLREGKAARDGLSPPFA
jgi:prephenate dehydrogenase